MFKVFSRQLLIRPDLAPYLMASSRARLYAGAGTPLYWTNNAQVRVNTLDNKSLGTQAFSVSFAVTREFVILSTWTRYILSYPGIMDVKAEDGKLWFKFNWEASPVWKYISSSELVPGWNNVSLESNGQSVITLVVNSTTHTIIDSNALPTYRWFSGFNDSSYILPNDILEHYEEGPIIAAGEISNYEHTIKIRLTALGVSNQGIMDAGATNANTGKYINAIRWTITTDGFIHYRISTGGGETYPVDITGTEKLPLNTDILCKATYNKTTGYSVKHSIDGGNTWVVDGTSSVTTPPYTLTASGWTPRLGDNAATGYSLQGSIDLAHTVFKCNGKEEFNGATAVESDTIRENTFIASGTLTEDTDKQEYPASIATGKLTLVQPWTVLKDVEAQLLGIVEPPTPEGPEQPTPAPKKETMFLSHFETPNDSLVDSATTYLTGAGNSSISITSSSAKFGNNSFQSGANDWFKIITENKEPEEYTVEGWLFPLGNEAKFVIGSCAAVEGGVYNGFEIWTQANGTVRYNITNNAGAVDGGMKYLPEATPNNWHHFALVKSKQGIFGALDGKLVLVNADTTKLGWQKVINVGKAIRTSNVLPYPLDELRITKYNSLKDFDPDNLTYTVPTQAFQFETNVEPDTPINPPADYDDEGAPVSAKDLPTGWAMFKIISDQGDLNNNNWYRYTQELPHEVVDGWHPVTSYTLPSIDSIHDNSPIGLAEWYPSYLAKGWLYVYSSSGPDYEAKLIRNRINE